ncbi:MAG TPA: outer membrane beta-barrel protein [Steroidobacteraceae bacterium]|nr:outer membrane beta-barrel protein [Steroidobacteraceae bacterium]
MKLSRVMVVATLALFGGVASADDGRGFYVGLGAGVALADVDQDELDAMVFGPLESEGLEIVDASSKLSDSDASLGLLVGYRFLPWLAVEAEWLTLGTTGYEAHADVWTGDFIVPLKTTLETDSKGIAVSALGLWPVSQRWDLYGRIGVLMADTTVTARVSSDVMSIPFSDSKSSQEVLAGIGAAWKASPTWTVRLDYQHFQDVGDEEVTGEASIDRLSLQWLYTF